MNGHTAELQFVRLLKVKHKRKLRLFIITGWMFSLTHFQYKSINISTILTSKLKPCLYIWKFVSWLLLGIYFLSGIQCKKTNSTELRAFPVLLP